MHGHPSIDFSSAGIINLSVVIFSLLVKLLSFRWLPVYLDNEKRIGVMSIGFLLKEVDEAVVWRGPKKNGKNLEHGIVFSHLSASPDKVTRLLVSLSHM